MIESHREIFRWGPIPGRFYYMSEFVLVCTKFFGEKYAGERWVETLLLFRNNRMVWINQMESLQNKGKELFLKYMLRETTRKKIRLEWEKNVSNLIQFQKEIESKKLEKLDEIEFKELVQKFFQLTIDFWIDTIPAELGNYGSEGILKNELKKYIQNEEELSSVMEILTTPEKSSFYQEEEMNLIETKDIKKHQKEFFWLQNSYAGTKILDVAYFEDRKKKLREDLREENQNRIKKIEKDKGEIIYKYKLPENVLGIAKAISDNIIWQDERKRHIFINLHYKHLILEEVVRRYKYEMEDLLNAWFTEIEKIILGKNLHEELRERKDGFGVHFIENCENISAQNTIKYWEEYVYEKIIENVDQFIGTIASKGKQSIVQGRVKIILDPFQTKSFQKGDILIAPMTSPEYVFLMEKATAIITDTGGLTCHAAIVSREFNVPCIVGTKIATQVLKDGDLIEVNTEKGTIKRITKL